MEPIRYYVPTRGRVGRQATVRNFPSGLRYLLTIVCPEDEVQAHRKDWASEGVQVISQPSCVETIGEKREFIMLNASNNVRFAWMLDDDLKFKVCVDKRFVTPAAYAATFEDVFTNNITSLCDEFKAVGIGTSYFAPKGGVKLNYHLGFAFGFERDLRNSLTYPLNVFEDIDYTLQCLRGGNAIAVTYDVTVDQIKATTSDDPADGGVAGERTLSTIRTNLDQLIARHPGIVSEKPLRPGAHPAAITRVSWTKAAREGRLR